MLMKKTFYIFLWVLVGLKASFIAHAVLEMAEIKYAFAQGLIPNNLTFLGMGYCALPWGAQIVLLVLGAIGGFWAGLYFWKKVYGRENEKKSKKKRRKKENKNIKISKV